VVYGIGAQRFALMTGLSVSDAENVLRRYFGTYRELDTYLRDAGEPRSERATGAHGVRTAGAFRYDENDRQQITMTQRNGRTRRS
jgi:hypothetical protein